MPELRTEANVCPKLSLIVARTRPLPSTLLPTCLNIRTPVLIVTSVERTKVVTVVRSNAVLISPRKAIASNMHSVTVTMVKKLGNVQQIIKKR